MNMVLVKWHVWLESPEILLPTDQITNTDCFQGPWPRSGLYYELSHKDAPSEASLNFGIWPKNGQDDPLVGVSK